MAAWAALSGSSGVVKGAPKTVRTRVTSGVAVFSGYVPTREMARELRELARNFDGIRRVTGGLQLAENGERIAMDALPD